MDMKMKMALVSKNNVFLLLFLMVSILVFFGFFFSETAQGKTYYSRVDAASIRTLENTSDGTYLTWSKVSGATHYIIYRRDISQGSGAEFTKLKTITDNEITFYTDVVKPGEGLYSYTVVGCRATEAEAGEIVNAGDKSAAIHWLKPVEITSVSGPLLFSTNVTWNRSDTADGYTVQYGPDPLFLRYETKEVPAADAGTVDLDSKLFSKCYVRIRAYKKVNDVTYTSAWSYPSNIQNGTLVKTQYFKDKKGKYIEYRGLAKQKLYGYDTFQGSCNIGRYMYCALYNRKVEKFKIAKVNLLTGKVMKVSKQIFTGHGNGMTYNKNMKAIIATHKLKAALKVSIIDPSTLKLKKTQKITVAKRLQSKVKGISAIAYNAKRNQYVAVVSGQKLFAILDSSFKVQRTYTPGKKLNYINQDIACTDDIIMHVQSPQGQKYNALACYDWKGRFISRVDMNKNYELESVCVYNKTLYGAVYRAYFKTKKVTMTKIKKIGKKKKKVKVKVKKRVWTRDNNILSVAT